MEQYLVQNSRIWDQRVHKKKAHTRTVSKEDLENPLKHIDPLGWLDGNVAGEKVLCLASGGGLQSILFAKAGADVTVLDISSAMLDQDRKLARDLGLKIKILHQTMEDLSNLPDSYFDLIVQPVSTCYVPDVVGVYRQVARIIKKRGLYICQHKQPGSLQTSALPKNGSYTIEEKYYRSGPLKSLNGQFEHREPGAVEYLHRLEHLIGGLCREGFIIEDLMEPRHANSEAPVGSFGHRSLFSPPYILIKARKRELNMDQISHNRPSGLIIPG